jgi:hypothetical protein
MIQYGFSSLRIYASYVRTTSRLVASQKIRMHREGLRYISSGENSGPGMLWDVEDRPAIAVTGYLQRREHGSVFPLSVRAPRSARCTRRAPPWRSAIIGPLVRKRSWVSAEVAHGFAQHRRWHAGGSRVAGVWRNSLRSGAACANPAGMVSVKITFFFPASAGSVSPAISL